MKFITLLLLTLCWLSYSPAVTATDNCEQKKTDIMEKLEEARNCTSDDECIGKNHCICPFGSYHILNKNSDVESIEAAMKHYAHGSGCSACLYDCMGLPSNKFFCNKGKCDVQVQHYD